MCCLQGWLGSTNDLSRLRAGESSDSKCISRVVVWVAVILVGLGKFSRYRFNHFVYFLLRLSCLHFLILKFEFPEWQLWLRFDFWDGFSECIMLWIVACRSLPRWLRMEIYAARSVLGCQQPDVVVDDGFGGLHARLAHKVCFRFDPVVNFLSYLMLNRYMLTIPEQERLVNVSEQIFIGLRC